MIRKPIVTVLGHVDHGKTSLLDKIRGSTLAKKEAGGITQHIGATEVPLSVIEKISGDLLKKYRFKLKIPGLFFIDTPGHEAFTNLRKRGGSISDIAILVVDVMQGCQNQTYEALDILRHYRVPFIVALNKVDMIYGWRKEKEIVSITESLKKQDKTVLEELDKKLYSVVGQLHERGLQSEMFDRVEDFTKTIVIVPVSAISGEGLPEILCFLAGLSQKYLEKRLEIHPEEKARGVVLETKEEKGLGKTIDVILYDGVVRLGDEFGVVSSKGIEKRKVKALLQPRALEEIREAKSKFERKDVVYAAAGVKILASDLENVLAGSPFLVFENEEELLGLKKEIEGIEFESVGEGVVVRADSLGSLEALVGLLKEKGIKIKKAKIGSPTKKDFSEALAIGKKNIELGVVIAFNVSVPEELLEEFGKDVGVIESKVIYKIMEDYKEWVEKIKKEERESIFKKIAYPVKIRVLPGCVFRKSKPAIFGVKVLEGSLRKGVFLIKEDGSKIGKIREIQEKGKSLEKANKGEEIAISVEGAIFEKDFKEDDLLYSYISREDYRLLRESNLLNIEEKELLDEIFEIVRRA